MDQQERPLWKGRGRAMSPVHVSRSLSLSSESRGSGQSGSSSGVSQVSTAVGTLNITDAPTESVVGPRTRSPVDSRRVPRYREKPSVTRPATLLSKKGSSGTPSDLLVNYFMVKKAPSWSLYQYRVDFNPHTDFKQDKKAFLRQHGTILGSYLYDGGHDLFTSTIYENDPISLSCVTDPSDPATRKTTVVIRRVAQLEPGDCVYIRFYNILLKRCLGALRLKEMGRGVFDTSAPINVPEFNLSLYPGFITSIRQHEQDVLLCVDTVHKVIRQDSVLDNLDSIQKTGKDTKEFVRNELIGSIVLTHYNQRTYKITDVDWNASPKHTFDWGGKQVTYSEYYLEKYKLKVDRLDQPMLIAEPKTRDFHRRSEVEDEGNPRVTYLIPQFCQMTGLSDGMRSNLSLMKELAKHLHMGPQGRVQEITNFMKRIQSESRTVEFMKNWNLEFSPKPLECLGRVLPAEKIVFSASSAGDSTFPAGEKADWTMAFRNKKMLSSATIKSWSIMVPERDAASVDNLVSVMMKVGKPIGFNIPRPKEVLKTRPGVTNYMKAIDRLCKNNNDFIFVVLPNNKLDLYSAVKKKLSAEIGLVSQCFLAKNMTSKGLMSIATKVVIQINAKLGGEPWSVQVPMKKLMVVGFDVYHAKRGSKANNVASMVSSYSNTFATYYSTSSFYNKQDELSAAVCTDFSKCLEVYKSMNNGELPERIIFYRDGVGEGDLEYVISLEVQQIIKAMNEKYASNHQPPAKLTYVVVSKKINTRLFSKTGRGDAGNPPPGTICDDIVTLPDRFDFFLIPQTARQGAVSPVSFNVIFDNTNILPDRLQRLTYKFCHLYFNWSGTVAVPAPCQYAHKLAALTGQAIGREPHDQLSYNLHFL